MKIKLELSKVKPIFIKRKYFLIFLGTTVVSFILFLLLTFMFEWSSFLFFNYFLKEGVSYIGLTFIIITAFSLLFGFTTSFVAYNFETIIDKKLFAFLGIAGALYIITYVLMLANTSYSLFSYTEMNGFLYTLTNFLLIAPILPLSSLLVVNIYTTIKDVKSGVSGAGGLAAGLFSLGCPTCGSLLLPLLGITAGLTIFPFKGLELKLLSLALLGFTTYKLNSTCSTRIPRAINLKAEPFFSQKFESIMLIAIVLTAGLVFFNQIQISSISSSLSIAGAATGGGILLGTKADLTGADVSQVTSTAMAIATVFPELKDAKNDQDIINIMLPSGTPEYSEALGGITFDDPVTSLNYLAKWWYSLKEEVKQNDPQTWQRFLSLAAAPRGISCEFCCGVGPQGITADGNLRCGCQHNPAAQAIALGLMKYTDYSDAQVLREVMRWKTIFFPKNMISLGIQVAGQDPSQIGSLPGMVGGC